MIERHEQLEKVARIFNVPLDKEDWLLKSIRTLKNEDNLLELGQINSLFTFIDRNLSNVNNNCWKLIKELSSADDFIIFLRKIDIKNLDDHSDERLIQEDTISLLIQVKQFLFPLMDKETIADFLGALQDVIKKNSTLGEKIALCNNSNMALQKMYNNIYNTSNYSKVIKEKIKNAVTNGTYTFICDQKVDKCLVSLNYPSKDNIIYNLNEILDLRERALIIAKLKASGNNKIDDDAEMLKNVMNEFVAQVDIAQEISNVVSVLIQMGHFGYRKFEKQLHETEKMKEYLKFLKDELEKW